MPGKYITLSHEILREYGEYERTSTTALNAYIGPKVSTYLEDLESKLKAQGFQGDLLIMQSNGGVMPPSTAKSAAGGDAGIGAGRRVYRRRPRGMPFGLQERDRLRHGWHHRQDQPDSRRRADRWPTAITSAAMLPGIR